MNVTESRGVSVLRQVESAVPERQSFDREKQLNDKREAILKVAGRLISKHGFAHVSLDQVAAELSIAKPAIYYYFKSKEQILFECFNRAFGVAEQAMSEAESLEGSGRERFEYYMRRYLETQLGGAVPTLPLHDLKALSPSLRAKVERRRKDRRDRLRVIVSQGVDDGSLRPCDPALVVSAWGGTVGWIVESFDPRGSLEPADIIEEIVNLFLRGVAAAPPRPSKGKA
ncbi:MAG: TetR/AcrR family transcriptional regulator [Lautropia sp.]